MLILQFLRGRHIFLRPSEIVELIGLIEEPRRKILRIENPHLLFIHEDEENALCDEEAGVDAMLTDVESVILDGRDLLWGGTRVGIEGDLQDLTPGYCEHGIGPITAARGQSLTPIDVGHSPLIDIVGLINKEELLRFRGDLSY